MRENNLHLGAGARYASHRGEWPSIALTKPTQTQKREIIADEVVANQKAILAIQKEILRNQKAIPGAVKKQG